MSISRAQPAAAGRGRRGSPSAMCHCGAALMRPLAKLLWHHGWRSPTLRRGPVVRLLSAATAEDSTAVRRRVCVVGSGPAGFYATQALLRSGP
eukprot:COSAG01_NODE_45367_length_410_cov_0.524116_1_plen_92_part_01